VVTKNPTKKKFESHPLIERLGWMSGGKVSQGSGIVGSSKEKNLEKGPSVKNSDFIE